MVIDPRACSNSNRMSGIFAVKRAHVGPISATFDVLHPEGVMWFLTNAIPCKVKSESFSYIYIEDTTARTVSTDFAKRHSHRLSRLLLTCMHPNPRRLRFAGEVAQPQRGVHDEQGSRTESGEDGLFFLFSSQRNHQHQQVTKNRQAEQNADAE